MIDNVLAVDGRTPAISGNAWVAPTATVVGSATIGAGTGIFYGAVVRADMEAISIGADSNIQDGAVVHADPGYPARIGSRVSVGHGAVLHGCTIGDGALIGMRRPLTPEEIEHCSQNAATYTRLARKHRGAVPLAPSVR